MSNFLSCSLSSINGATELPNDFEPPLRLSYQLFHVDERERLTNDFSVVSLIVICEDLNYFERENEFKSYLTDHF